MPPAGAYESRSEGTASAQQRKLRELDRLLNMRPRALPFLITLASLFANPIAAIFADEAYQIDYHYPLLGLPQAHATFFHRPSAESKAALLYTLSERQILGAVNPKDGALLWRQRLLEEGENGTTTGLLKAGEGADIVVSAVAGTVQAWDAIDGRLAWESRASGKVKALDVLTGVKGEKDVLVAYEEEGAKTTVKRHSEITGEVSWTRSESSGNSPFALICSGEVVYCLSLHSGLLGSSKIQVTQFDLTLTGKNAPQPAQPAENEVNSEDSILYADNNAGTPLLVWTDKAFKTVKINVIGSKPVKTVNVTPKAGESVNKIVVHAAAVSGAHPHFLIHYQSSHSNWAEVYHVDPKSSKVGKAFDLAHIGGKGAFSVSSVGNEVYFIRHTPLKVTLYSSKNAHSLTQWNVQSGDSAVEDPVHATSEVLMRAGAKYSLRSALVLASGDWELIRNGDKLWSRLEGLSGLVAAGFADFANGENLLEELAIESHSGVPGAYIHRVRRHLKQLQYFPEWIQGLPDRMLPDFLGGKADSEAQAPYAGFGFNRVAIVASEDGRLAALDTANQGKLLWSIQAVDLPAGQKWHVLSIDPEEGSTLVRGAGGEFLRVDTNTGTILAYQPGAMVASLKTSIPIADSQGRHALVPVNSDGSLGDVTNAGLTNGVVVVTKGDDNILRGWKLSKNGKKTLVWQFAPAAGEEIQSIQPPPAHDPVASIGKALGDRNVLYKYLNPNILLIATIGAKTATANIYIVDSSSGAVLYSAAHTGVDTSQPISSTLTENWFAYSLFSESKAPSEDLAQIDQKPIKGYQLIISELFESPFPNDRGPLGESANFSSTRPLVADEGEMTDNPHVISQTFLIPGPISHMTTTSTLQGITPRSLLCTISHINALLSIPRHILDPRRPVGRDPTPLEAEEGLFRYSPVLEFEPKWILSHRRDLLSIADVITSPSKLESTSLVFAFGDLDIFGTRVSPIGSFDMLGKGFSKLQLVGTVVALAIGTSLLAPFVRRKQIDGQWKA